MVWASRIPVPPLRGSGFLFEYLPRAHAHG